MVPAAESAGVLVNGIERCFDYFLTGVTQALCQIVQPTRNHDRLLVEHQSVASQFIVVTLTVVCIALINTPAIAANTDGDGLLDILDLPGFDPHTNRGNFGFRGIEDLDGANQLGNVSLLFLSHNGIRAVEVGDFRGLSDLNILDLNSNLISNIERGAFSSLSRLRHLDLGSNNHRAN